MRHWEDWAPFQQPGHLLEQKGSLGEQPGQAQLKGPGCLRGRTAEKASSDTGVCDCWPATVQCQALPAGLCEPQAARRLAPRGRLAIDRDWQAALQAGPGQGTRKQEPPGALTAPLSSAAGDSCRHRLLGHRQDEYHFRRAESLQTQAPRHPRQGEDNDARTTLQRKRNVPHVHT